MVVVVVVVVVAAAAAVSAVSSHLVVSTLCCGPHACTLTDASFDLKSSMVVTTAGRRRKRTPAWFDSVHQANQLQMCSRQELQKVATDSTLLTSRNNMQITVPEACGDLFSDRASVASEMCTFACLSQLHSEKPNIQSYIERASQLHFA